MTHSTTDTTNGRRASSSSCCAAPPPPPPVVPLAKKKRKRNHGKKETSVVALVNDSSNDNNNSNNTEHNINNHGKTTKSISNTESVATTKTYPITTTATTAAATSTTIPPSIPATISWASVFQQAASIVPLGGDLDHDMTFQPPASAIHPGLSQIAQLLLPKKQQQQQQTSSSDAVPLPVLNTSSSYTKKAALPPASTSSGATAAAATIAAPTNRRSLQENDEKAGEGNVLNLSTAIGENRLKKKRKKKRKRLHQSEEEVQETKKKKKKLKQIRNVEEDYNSDSISDQEQPVENNENDADDDNDDGLHPCLEGQMISLGGGGNNDEKAMTMVLVDRTQGKVYSSTQRDANTGDFIQIGLWKNEKVVLSKSEDVDASSTIRTNPADDGNDNDDGRQQRKAGATTIPQFPFPTDPDDHCETPLQAYRDILPFLQFLQKQQHQHGRNANSQSSSSLRIYDPYYCNGSMKRHLSQLGFDNVYNVKEDCYQVWESGTVPDFDVLITNPPYSGDHIERLWHQLTKKTLTTMTASSSSSSGSSSFRHRPWLLLLPNWVHKKDFYKDELAANANANANNMKDGGCQPFYLVPKKRYVYEPPRHFRQAKKSDVHVKSSPFFSMWYIWGGTKDMTEKWIQHYRTWQQQQQQQQGDDDDDDGGGGCQLARTASALRDLRRRATKKSSNRKK